MLVQYALPDQIVRLWIDRKHKILHISCLKTNFSRIRINWKFLFDEGKETEQDKETERLDDIQFRERLDGAMIEKVYGKILGKQITQNPNGIVK